MLAPPGNGAQWKVADVNTLRRSPILTEFLQAAPRNVVVITDFCCMECYKGDALRAIQKSLVMISQHPGQIAVLKGTQQVAALTGQRVLLREEMVDWEQTRGFAQFCTLVARAASGDRGLLTQIDGHGAEVNTYLAKLADQTSSIGESVKLITEDLPPDMVRRLRSNTPLTDDDIKVVMTGVALLARAFYEASPQFVGPALQTNPSSSFTFRFALASYLLAISWIASGGVESASRSRLANDVVDMNYVTFATFFDGVLSRDKKVNEIYEEARLFLDTVFVDVV